MRVRSDIDRFPVLSLFLSSALSRICQFWAKFCDFGDCGQIFPVPFPVIRLEQGFQKKTGGRNIGREKCDGCILRAARNRPVSGQQEHPHGCTCRLQGR